MRGAAKKGGGCCAKPLVEHLVYHCFLDKYKYKYKYKYKCKYTGALESMVIGNIDISGLNVKGIDKKIVGDASIKEYLPGRVPG